MHEILPAFDKLKEPPLRSGQIVDSIILPINCYGQHPLSREINREITIQITNINTIISVICGAFCFLFPNIATDKIHFNIMIFIT